MVEEVVVLQNIGKRFSSTDSAVKPLPNGFVFTLNGTLLVPYQ